MKYRFSQRGASAVELALLLPLLLAITFGLIEFGLFMYNQQVLTNAAREGARLGILQRDTSRYSSTEIQQEVMRYLRPPNGAGPWRIITFNTNPNPNIQAPDTCNTGWSTTDYVRVTISLTTPYLVADDMIQLASLGLLKLPPITLSTESVMKCE
jgi:Flp pilus assembly protein TadG